MTLDQHAQAVLDWLESVGGRDVADGTVEQARKDAAGFVKMQAPPEDVGEVRDIAIPGPAGVIPARYYRAADAPDSAPVFMMFHGGGFVIGDLEIVDRVCRILANRIVGAVVSVDYRLAPEHPFPAAPEDCYAATAWVHDNAADFGIDPAKIIVGGDSAGGNLAAVVSQMAADRGGPPIAYQVLIYPGVDAVGDYESYRENGEGYLLTMRSIEWFHDKYTRPEDDPHWMRSPLHGTLTGQPPAIIVIAGYDPLRDQCRAYADALSQAGVPVHVIDRPGQIHIFMWLTGAIPDSMVVYDEIAAKLRADLG